jgi:hypothetical protein
MGNATTDRGGVTTLTSPRDIPWFMGRLPLCADDARFVHRRAIPLPNRANEIDETTVLPLLAGCSQSAHSRKAAVHHD